MLKIWFLSLHFWVKIKIKNKFVFEHFRKQILDYTDYLKFVFK